MSKKDTRKKRDTMITFDLSEEYKQIKLTYDIKTESLSLDNAPDILISTQSSYLRENGKKKFINKSYNKKGAASFSSDKNIFLNYDYLVALDTNTKEINGERISVTSIYHVPCALKDTGDRVQVENLVTYAFFGVNEDINPETMGWFLFINKNIVYDFFKDKKLGIIVDSELGSHEEFITRKKPYYKNNYLPDFADFIYSSSDTGSDYLSNYMLRYCDKHASKVMDEIKENRLTPEVFSFLDSNSRGYIKIISAPHN